MPTAADRRAASRHPAARETVHARTSAGEPVAIGTGLDGVLRALEEFERQEASRPVLTQRSRRRVAALATVVRFR